MFERGLKSSTKQLTQPPGSQMSWLACFCSAPPWSKTTWIYIMFVEFRQYTNTTELHTVRRGDEENNNFQRARELNLSAASAIKENESHGNVVSFLCIYHADGKGLCSTDSLSSNLRNISTYNVHILKTCYGKQPVKFFCQSISIHNLSPRAVFPFLTTCSFTTGHSRQSLADFKSRGFTSKVMSNVTNTLLSLHTHTHLSVSLER